MCPKRGCVRSVNRCNFHHMLGDDLEPVLLAITWRNVVGREMDPHGCPALVAPPNPTGAALIASRPNEPLYSKAGVVSSHFWVRAKGNPAYLVEDHAWKARARRGDHAGSASAAFVGGGEGGDHSGDLRTGYVGLAGRAVTGSAPNQLSTGGWASDALSSRSCSSRASTPCA